MTRLVRPPIPGPLGQEIYEKVSQEAWDAWLLEQTRIINEERLNLADATHRATLLRHMSEYFFGKST